MASKLLLIASFVAIATGNAYVQAQSLYDQVQAHHAMVNAQIQAQAQAMAGAFGHSYGNQGKYVWVPEDDDEEPAPPGYKRMYVPPLPQPPYLPGFGPALHLPQPPPLYVRDFSQGFHHFPQHRHFNFGPVVHIPNPGDIKNIKPAPGQVFSGVYVKSSSGFGKDKDGKTIRTGGTTLVTNDNGDVKETKVGKNPPNIEDPIEFPSSNEFVMPKMPDPVTFKPHKPYKPHVFKPIIFEPITFKPIDMNYVPAEGENYVATSFSSHSESSDIDGVKTSSGGKSDMLNVNGAVDHSAVEFRQGDDPDKAEGIVEEE